MKAVIIEDETAAAVNLQSILHRVAPAVEITAVLEGVEESVEWFGTHPQPDLVLMDIHLADGEAFRIFERVSLTAPVIFTTAYDRYALEAFKVDSIDYLLKPIKEEEVRRALEKLRRLSGLERSRYSGSNGWRSVPTSDSRFSWCACATSSFLCNASGSPIVTRATSG